MKSVVGMKDNYGTSIKVLRYLEDTLLNLSSLYGFTEIKTPLIEYSEVFNRSLGEDSDVVSKEMFNFNDKNGDSLTLRPENTAGIMRAVFSEGLLQKLPLKLFYAGPMFRYESPQKGRYRQFTQLGVEVLGIDVPQIDVEVISLAWKFVTKLNLNNDCVLEINSLGDLESREKYKTALTAYLENKQDKLSVESQKRFKTNILRILDSKDENDQLLLKEAPKLKDYLSTFSDLRFKLVLELLTLLDIPYKVNDNLVRGLDYYSETVFEIVTDKIGAQSTILAGGRYNDLAEQMGGVKFSGIGFAAGAERLALLIDETKFIEKQVDVAMITFNDLSCVKYGQQVTQKLREAGYLVEIPYNESLNKKMKKANSMNARCAIIIGENEAKSQTLSVKWLASGTQESLSMDEVLVKLQNK